MTDTARSNYIALVGEAKNHLFTDLTAKKVWDMMQNQHDELSIAATVRVDAAVMQTVPSALEMHTAYEKALKKDE